MDSEDVSRPNAVFAGQEFVPFHPGDGIRPVNQDAIAQGIVWSGQMVVENPLFMIRLVTG